MAVIVDWLRDLLNAQAYAVLCLLWLMTKVDRVCNRVIDHTTDQVWSHCQRDDHGEEPR